MIRHGKNTDGRKLQKHPLGQIEFKYVNAADGCANQKYQRHTKGYHHTVINRNTAGYHQSYHWLSLRVQ